MSTPSDLGEDRAMLKRWMQAHRRARKWFVKMLDSVIERGRNRPLWAAERRLGEQILAEIDQLDMFIAEDRYLLRWIDEESEADEQ